jgi:phage-related protein
VIQGNNTARVLYFFAIGKKTNRTPSNEIKLAKKYKEDYMKRRD